MALVALALVLGLGAVSHLAHTATIANVGLPASNSEKLAGLAQYDPQVELTRDYLNHLVRLDYAGAYADLAPSVRVGLSEAQFEAARRKEGVLGPPNVWADDAGSARAEYVLGRGDGSQDTSRHRFLLKQEQGRWWIDHEVAIPSALPPAPNLTAALHAYVQRRAGLVWTNSIELLRQEGFADGQLLLFSYIEPDPAAVLTSERIAVLAYYVDTAPGWQFSGGGNTGLAAAMNMADVSMGFTAFGPNQRYVAYYGVVENSNATTLTFEEPNGATHRQDLKGLRTLLFVNERTSNEPLPFDKPFKSLQVVDGYGNLMRTNPASSG